MININSKEIISLFVLFSFFIVGEILIFSQKVIEGLFIGFSGALLIIIIDKIPPEQKQKKKIDFSKITVILFFSLGYISLAILMILLVIKTAPNILYINIFAGGFFGAIYSYLLFEINDTLKSEKQHTSRDVLLGIIFFLVTFCILIIGISF